jgi:hypothetical protein
MSHGDSKKEEQAAKVRFWERKREKGKFWSSLKVSYVAAAEVVEWVVQSSWLLEGLSKTVCFG